MDAPVEVPTMFQSPSAEAGSQPISRAALRAEIEKLYDTGCGCDGGTTPVFTSLARALGEADGVKDSLDVLRWVIPRLGGGQQSQIVSALLGIDKTRGLSKIKRWTACAALSDRYTSGDSFRHGKVRGKNIIDVYLDEVTDQLIILGEESGLLQENPTARLILELVTLPSDKLLSVPLQKLEEYIKWARDQAFHDHGDYYPHWNPMN
jgi:hypothetical protein